MGAGHKGEFYIDSKDDAVRHSLVLDGGELKWPPPPLPAPPPPPPRAEEAKKEDAPVDMYKVTMDNAMATTGGAAGIMALGFVSPSAPLSVCAWRWPRARCWRRPCLRQSMVHHVCCALLCANDAVLMLAMALRHLVEWHRPFCPVPQPKEHPRQEYLG